MSDKTKVGLKIADFSLSPKHPAYTGVILKVDNDTSYTAGNTSGTVLNVSLSWGTQAIANNIYALIAGFEYQPYSAVDALLDPAAEIGDGIGIYNVYGILAEINTTFDEWCAADISSPAGNEITSEYPYLPPIERKIQIAQDTAQDAQDTASSALDTASSALDAAQDAASDADNANAVIQAWRYPGASVQIDGANIKAGTIMASELLGGIVGLLNANETQVGTITITGASSADVAIELASIGALRLVASGGNVFIQNSSGNYLQVGSSISVNNNFIPNGNNYYSLGNSSFKWTDVYATNSTIQTSDRKVKTNINYDMSRYDELFKQIKPVTYKFMDGHRTHIGYIAQDIEIALNECNISTEEFAGFIKSDEDYALRYGEFIALNTYQIQLLQSRVEAQEAEINELKQEIRKIKNALGGSENG